MNTNDPRLTSYVVGELDDEQRAEIEQQIARSPELREEVAAMRRAASMLGSALQAEPAASLTPAQHQAIEDQAADRKVSLPARSASTRTSLWKRHSLQAVSLLLIAGLVFALSWPAVQRSRESALGTTPNKDTQSAVPATEAAKTPASADFDSLIELITSEPSDFETPGEPAARSDFDAASYAPSSRRSNVESTRDSYGLDARGGMLGGGAMDVGMPSERYGDYGGNEADLRGEGWTLGGRESVEFFQPQPGQSGESLDEDRMLRSGAYGGGGMAAGDMAYSIDDPEVGAEYLHLGSSPSAVNDHFGASPIHNPARPEGRAAESDFSTLTPALESLGRPVTAESWSEPQSSPARSRHDGEQFFDNPSRETAEPLPAAGPAIPDDGSDSLRSHILHSTPRIIIEEESEEALQIGAKSRAAGRERGRVEDELEQLGQTLDEKKLAEPAKPQRTWRRAAATPNASRLMIGDRDELLLEGMQANVLVDGFRARVLLDLYYFNNRGQQLEGNFKLRLPNEASLYYFAFGESAYEYRPQVDQLASKGFLTGDLVRASGLSPRGILEAREGSWSNVKEARIVPREKAAHAYSETVRRRVDPALVEWSGAGVFNARVFPLQANKLHRIVVGYDVNLQQVGDDLVYKLELPEDAAQCMVDLNVSALPGTSATIEPDARPFTSSGRAYYHIDDLSDREVVLRMQGSGPILLTGDDPQAGDFFATRVTPELPAGEMTAGGERAIFLVDTSLSSRPDKFNVWLDLLEASLAENRDSLKQFAVLFFNIESHWWKEGFADNTPENVDELIAYCRSLSLEGATDLRQALQAATAPAWNNATGDDGATDLFLLSDGAATWGELNVHRLSQVLTESKATLFAYKTGMTGTATGVLEHLTRESGGAVFSVVNAEEVAAAATSHRRRPWKLLDVTMPGGSDLLVAGRPQYIYPGQPLLIVGRGEPDAEVMLDISRGEELTHISVPIERTVESELASRLYGQVSVGQLEDLGSSLEDVSVAYARHFRVTGQTCSLLMLESEADYQRFNIKPEDDTFVVRSTPAAELITKKLDELAASLGDAKAALAAWLGKLEGTPGLQFKVPTALRLVIDRLPSDAFDVEAPKLVCKSRERGGVPKEFIEQLDSGKLDYKTVTEQAQQRFAAHGAADGLRTLSSLVEQNPGDPVLTRDVAFSAIEWGLGGQAYPLLRRVASLRPYEPQSYQAMAQCLSELGYADLAMIYYEVAMSGRWHERYKDINQIATVEYLRLLRRIDRGELSSQAPEYAKARLESLAQQAPIQEADLVITMMWNTDRTDVDLHVIEPTGEECYYEHPQTRIGGRITRDVTEGLGPEMYTLPNAKSGDYKILANYFGSDTNRTQVRTKVSINIYEHFGRPDERLTKKTITLSDQKEKRELAQVSK